MAIPVQSPKVGTALQAAFGLQGRVRPYLEESIIPTVLVGSLEQGTAPYIRRHATTVANVSAVAGQYGTARFEMIPGTIAVITELQLEASGTSGYFWFNFAGNAATLAALASTAPKGYTDGRLLAGSPAGAQDPAAVFTFGAQAAPLAAYQASYYANAGTPYILEPQGWVVGSGSASLYGFLEIQFNQVNSAARIQMQWDEYQVI